MNKNLKQILKDNPTVTLDMLKAGQEALAAQGIKGPYYFSIDFDKPPLPLPNLLQNRKLVKGKR